MNPSVVNRKDIVSKFKLTNNSIRREVAQVDDANINYADNTIHHKTMEQQHNLSLAISSKLPNINKKLGRFGETPYKIGRAHV